MEPIITWQVDGMDELFQLLRKKYKWSAHDLTLRFVTLLYYISDKSFDEQEYDETLKFIKKNTKMFSIYRGHQMFSIAALLATRFDDPKNSFQMLLEYEHQLRKNKFKHTPYLGIAAYALMLTCPEEYLQERIQKTIDIYQKMKQHHFWLTSSDDYPIAVLLAGSEKNIDALADEMERCYKKLSEAGFSKGNGLQFVSHLLTFSPESVEDKVERCKKIYVFLKHHKLALSPTYYGIIGYLALLGDEYAKALEDIVEIVQYLKSKNFAKGFYKDMNVLISTALVCNQYAEKYKIQQNLIETGVGISIEAMIAAQTAALIAVTTAATTAVTTASGN
ncbi:MAG: hypothetical protein PWP27_2576 [Clostridiales bacterium]|jgi:hypothetical protein|nr:hypothetical protein [Clostridiales bacterium]MDK2934766.1 hypothetical protein [Clostridiales bacterium]